eukprot:jgi/Botrbrau1/70/Bobra.0022s0062.1
MVATFEGFVIERILSQDNRTKTLNVLGRFEGKDGQAIVLLVKKPFTADAVQLSTLLSAKTRLEEHFNNDIYSKYDGYAPAEHALLLVDLIYPATEKHIQKYSVQTFVLVRESPEEYREITLPYIESIPASRIQWVYNILEKKAEAERLIFEDTDPETGFMLHPDMKWDGKEAAALYCIALCLRRDVRSLRDLRPSHLPLLRNLQTRVPQVLKEKYCVEPELLRAYVHYQPSYYHFHVHFVHTSLDMGGGAAVGKAHLLDDIIDNLSTIDGEYYAQRTLTFSLGENEALLGAFRNRNSGADTEHTAKRAKTDNQGSS